METQTPPSPLPWWAIAPKDGFTALVIKEQLPRMQQSKAASQINTTVMIVGWLDRKG